MFASIRRYIPRPGSVTRSDLDALKRRIEDRFAPVVFNIYGFHGYYVMSVDDREVVAVIICDTREAAREANRRAAAFVQEDPLGDRLGTAQVLEGPVLMMREAGVGAH